MRHSALALLAAAAACLGAAPLLAQNEAAGQPAAAQPAGAKDPREILKAAQKAAAELKTVTYKASAVGSGAIASIFPGVTADVSMARLDEEGNPIGGKILIDGEVTPTGKDKSRMTLSYDGKTTRSFDHAAKKVVEAKDAAALQALLQFIGSSGAAAVIFTPFMQAEAFTQEIESQFVTYAGAESVNGVACDVVDVHYEAEDSGPSAKIAFGVADHLPRRVVWSFSVDPENQGAMTISLSDLKLNPAVAAGVFVAAIPTGYAVEEFKAPPPRASEEESALLPTGTAAPDWTLKDPEGKEVTLSKLRGKVVVLDFWATWCPPCRQAMPGVQALHEKFKDKGVLVFGIDTWEENKPGDPKQYMADQKFTYGLLMNGNDVATAYNVTGIPTFYVIGVDGAVLYSTSGFAPGEAEKISEVIDGHLKAQAEKGGGGK